MASASLLNLGTSGRKPCHLCKLVSNRIGRPVAMFKRNPLKVSRKLKAVNNCGGFRAVAAISIYERLDYLKVVAL